MLLRIFLVLLMAAPAISLRAEPDAGEGGKPQLIRHVTPVYPPEAKQAGIEGRVELEAIIAKDGRIRAVNALDGEPVLTAAATAAVKQWQYRPVVLNGKPVEVVTRITVNFELPK